MMTPFDLERYQRILDHYTRKRIIIFSLLIILGINTILYGAVNIYLEHLIQEDVQLINELKTQIYQAEEIQQETEQSMTLTSQLPEAAAFLKDCFIEYGLDIEELVLTPLLAQDPAIFKQAVMTIRVKGERNKVFQAVEAVQNTDNFLYIVQELEINGLNARIQFKLLMHQTS